MSQRVENLESVSPSDAEMHAAVEAINQKERLFEALPHRSSKRFALRSGHHVVMGFNDQWGRSVTVAPTVRDVSRGGLSVLHSVGLESGLRVACLFIGPSKRAGLRVPGQIIRCRLVRGMVYEMGVQFQSPAAIYPFVRLEGDDPSAAPEATPYPAIDIAKRQFVEMVNDGAPLAMLREALVDLHLAIGAEEESRIVRVDPNTGLVGPEELDQ